MKILVDTGKQILRIGAQEYPCAIGKNGAIAEQDGREGDGKTPLGTYKVRYGLYRADRITLPPSKLTFWRIHRKDGWCDTPGDPAYNRPMCLTYAGPHPASAEELWLDDHVYDILIVLGHNDNPPIANMGSAVFLHIAREDYGPTLGCVAISQADMLALVAVLSQDSLVEIR